MSARREPLVYPVTKQVDQVDDYHGTQVADPYRWLEDLDSDDTRAWVEAQNALTSGYLEGIPFRERFKNRLTQLWDHDKFGAPWKDGGRYFVMRQTGLQNQFALYVSDRLDGEERLLVDPNTWSEDGTIALTGVATSEDGRYLAMGISSGGSDWMEWKVLDVETGDELSDHLRYIKFSGASWTPDGKGFFYSRYAEPDGDQKLEDVNRFHKVCFHRVGTTQAEDELVYERSDQPDWLFGAKATDDGRWLVISASQGTDPRNGVFIKDLREPGAEVVPLLADFDALWVFLDCDGDTLWFHTDLDAPLGRVVAVDARDPSRRVELIAESADALEWAKVVGNRFVCGYLQDARSAVKVFELDGTFVRDVELPGIGYVFPFSGKRTDDEAFTAFSSYTVPTSIYRHDIASGEHGVSPSGDRARPRRVRDHALVL